MIAAESGVGADRQERILHHAGGGGRLPLSGRSLNHE